MTASTAVMANSPRNPSTIDAIANPLRRISTDGEGPGGAGDPGGGGG